MKSFGRLCSGPKYGSSSFVRAPKNSISLPPSNLPDWRSRRRHSVIARIGALPVPVQIITTWLFGWFGIRKLAPKGPITCTGSPTFRSHTKLLATPRTGRPSWSSSTRFTVRLMLL